MCSNKGSYLIGNANPPRGLNLPRAAKATGRPRAVGDADEDGAVLSVAPRLPELQHEGEERRVNVPAAEGWQQDVDE